MQLLLAISIEESIENVAKGNKTAWINWLYAINRTKYQIHVTNFVLFCILFYVSTSEFYYYDRLTFWFQ